MAIIDWGECPFGTAHIYELRAGKYFAKVSDFGATLVDFGTDDIGSVVLGSDDLGFYLGKCGSIGATIGRFANRIANGRFTLDGKDYQLNCNESPTVHLHGGNVGFEKRLWTAVPDSDYAVTLRYISPDGEENYPGTLSVMLRYELRADGTLMLHYMASTDAPTILNLTNHSYFNLGCENILGCEVTIPADRFVETGAGSIPTGKLADVSGTVMDLRGGVVVGERMADDYLKPTFGYDHCYVLTDDRTPDLHLAATVKSPDGVQLECFTDQPGVQLYCGCQLANSPLVGRTGLLKQYAALCLETQVFPDAPNQPSFPSCVLRPGEVYNTTTVYRLSR